MIWSGYKEQVFQCVNSQALEQVIQKSYADSMSEHEVYAPASPLSLDVTVNNTVW